MQQKSMPSEIAQYLRYGWPLIPVWGVRHGLCCCPDGAECRWPGKHPIDKHGIKQARAEASAYKVGQNIAIRCGAGLTVLDIDGPVGEASLFQTLGEHPNTPTVRTGKGWHFYFSGDLPTRRGVLPGIDILGEGSYVMAPPSDHALGQRYEWLDGLGLEEVESLDATWIESKLLTKAPTAPVDQTLVQSALGYLDPDDYQKWLEVGFALCAAGLFDVWDEWSQRSEKYPGRKLLEKKAKSFKRENQRITLGSVFYWAQEAGWGGWSYTDTGNAERLVFRIKGRAYYVPQAGWYLYDGRRWQLDESDMVVTHAQAMAREIRRDRNDQAGKWSAQSLSRGKLEAAVALSKPHLAASITQFDQNPEILCVLNGCLNLRTLELEAHVAEDLTSRIASVMYDPGAACPEWRAFLETVLPDPHVRHYAQLAAGYTLTGYTDEQVFFVAFGGGGNGKSTFVETLRMLLGDYGRSMPFSGISDRPTGAGPSPEIARLAGARLVVASEPDPNARISESTIKDLTGSDTIAARFLHRDYFEFRPAFKLWLKVNRRLTIRGTDDGIWRRVKEIPFTVKITNPDKTLLERLREELPGILNWALEGASKWLETRQLAEPKVMRKAVTEYRAISDPVLSFLADSNPASGPLASVYSVYFQWAGLQNEKVLSTRSFSRRLQELGHRVWRRSDGMWVTFA